MLRMEALQPLLAEVPANPLHKLTLQLEQMTLHLCLMHCTSSLRRRARAVMGNHASTVPLLIPWASITVMYEDIPYVDIHGDDLVSSMILVSHDPMCTHNVLMRSTL